MKAHVGDRIVEMGKRVGDRSRIDVSTGVRNDDGTPPFVVRWLDTEHEALVLPGSDHRIEATNEEQQG